MRRQKEGGNIEQFCGQLKGYLKQRMLMKTGSNNPNILPFQNDNVQNPNSHFQ